jgi:predicted RNA-binding Zn-ribbon protein involved in translation (DUF1610 family)
MPIQFRCGACNQLLGIATRKAGAVVTCPTCGGKTIVPRPRKAEKEGAKRADFSLLERVDVDKLLGPPAPGKLTTPRPGAKSSPKQQPVAAGAASTALTPPGVPHEPKELRALPHGVAPEMPAANEIEDEDDLPQPLDESLVSAVVVLTKVRLASLALAVVLLTAGAFAVGYWLGSRG